MNFKLLELDTKLFGFGVAKILPERLSLEELQTIIDELRNQNVHLAYWPSDSTDEISQLAAKKLHGFLSSEQITYLVDLKKMIPSPLTAPEVEPYKEKKPNTELEQLALQAGTHSRFNLDPKLPQELFLKLYKVWIENSVNGSIASKVIVVNHDDKIAGMATLGEKNNRGDIGLLAVNSDFRGQKIGTKLVHATQAYFIEQGFSHAQVVTQKANAPACFLYEKCGFHKEKIENFYHFWI
jgi:dTDP-4-amino-4,6-dideoxy-D-galactose acyltransferase